MVTEYISPSADNFIDRHILRETMKIKSLVINLLFFAAWLFSMVLVYKQNYAGASASKLTQFETISPPKIGVQRWFNVTINDKKIGYAMNSYSESPLGYVFKDYSLLRMPMAGVVREVLVDFYAVVNDDFSIKSFTFGLASGDYSTDVFGTMSGNSLQLKVQTGDHISDIEFPADNGLYFPGVAPLLLASKGFPLGDFSLPSIDPFSLTVSDAAINVGPKEKLKIGDETFDVYRLEITATGVVSTMWVAIDGTVLKEEETAGMKMTLTSKEKALDIPDTDPQWDILKTFAVGVDRIIDNPREADYMKIQLTGIEPAGFVLYDDFQRVISVKPLIIEMNPSDTTKNIDNIITAEQMKAYTEPESFIQSDNQSIIHQANLIIKGVEDDSLKTVKLVDWIYINIEKDFAISIPSAAEVLRVRRGDCNEHSALFTAMARAAGIPTKICLGIVYSKDMFYYHAWPAVYVNGRWRAVDPTFGQQVADATHIKLLEGGHDSQASLMRVVGKLNVKIIELSNRLSIAENR